MSELPAAAWGYELLLIATWAAHFLLAGSVLGGALLLAARGLLRRGVGPLGARALREALPFALGLAITAGVAPLLFVLVLAPRAFASANLLLAHRWMALVPALIVAFYGLYLSRSAAWRARCETWAGRFPRLDGALWAALAALFLFVAWTWTENHLLSLRDRETWASFYGARRILWFEPALPLRFGAWVALSLATSAALLEPWLRRAGADAARERAALARTSAGALLAAALLTAGQLAALGRIGGAPGGAALGVLAVGLAQQAWGWRAGRPVGTARAPWVGAVLAALGLGVLREALRPVLDGPGVHDPRLDGGALLFAALVVLVGAILTWTTRAVLRELRGEG